MSRHCIGTYPKWLGRIIRWAINRNNSTNCSVEFKGRGMKGKYIRLQDGRKMRMSKYYRYGAPVSMTDKVAIYIVPKRQKNRRCIHEHSNNGKTCNGAGIARQESRLS